MATPALHHGAPAILPVKSKEKTHLALVPIELPNMDTTDKTKLAQVVPWSEAIPEECRVPNKSK